MANVVDVGGDAGSNLGQTDGTNVATFRLPGSPRYAVQSVVATVDNTAGADTTAKVTVKDSSGQVIATNEQGETIPAGDTGTATFALRLVDNGGVIRFNRVNRGGWVEIDLTSSFGGGPVAFVINLPAGKQFVVAGTDGTALSVEDGIVSLASSDRVLVQPGGDLVCTVGGDISAFALGGWSWTITGAATVALGSTFDLNAGTTNATLGGVFTSYSAGTQTVQLLAGQKLEVQNHLGAPIFRVNENGDLQGLTGKALNFNL